MNRIDLNGRWEFCQVGKNDWAPARVPGSVHGDLLRNKRIPDPHYRTNELDMQWVGRVDWEYRRTFRASAAAVKAARQVLVCEGLDTIATVYLNGKKAAETDNMFRRYEIDAARFLKPGENEIRVVFHSSVVEAARRMKKYNLDHFAWMFKVSEPHRNVVRKAQYACGWDWGPCLATCGVWRDIYIVAYDEPRIQYSITEQDHRPDGSVALRARVWLDVPENCSGHLVAKMDGIEAVSSEQRLRKGERVVEVAWSIDKPRLWFPNGHGAQPLYGLEIEWRNAQGAATDSVEKCIVLRKVELVREEDPDKSGESFYFKINGQPIFCKGANWIPGDLLLERMTRDKYERDLRACVDANMNMVRIWGGGIYERDDFYELCDELGLMVFQDMMFACAEYPAQKWFMDSVAAEVRHQIRRLYDYGCIVLWSGNNENEQIIRRKLGKALDSPSMREHHKIFYELIADIAAEEDKTRPYWPSSPSSGDGREFGERSRGDIHSWEVYNRSVTIRQYEEEKARFVSEFGFQSFPDIETMKTVARPEDMNPTSPVMDHHQRHPTGNTNIIRYMSDNFWMPGNFEHFIYVSQSMQLWAIQTGVEHWRRLKPYCMGTLYWQVNDCWPVASWASIDYEGRWKSLHYAARRFYNPLLISATTVEGKKSTLDIWACSDIPAPMKGTWKTEVVRLDGRRVAKFGGDWKLRSEESRALARIPLDEALGGHKPNEVLIFMDLKADGGALPADKRKALGIGAGALASHNSKILAEPKHYQLAKPKFQTRVENGPHGPRVRVKSDKPAMFVELNSGPIKGVFSDNWLNLPGNKELVVDFKGVQNASATELKKALKVRSLVETY